MKSKQSWKVAATLAASKNVAFQLTNILRDVREDGERGRQYLPMEDLVRFGVSLEDLRNGDHSANFTELVAFESIRGRRYYHELRPLLEHVDRRSRAS